MSRIVIELFEQLEPPEILIPWVARVVGSEDPKLSASASTPDMALQFLAEIFLDMPDGGAALIRTARPQPEVPA